MKNNYEKVENVEDKYPEWVTTTEAAEITGLSMRRIQELCKEGKYKAQKRGRDWLIEKESLNK